MLTAQHTEPGHVTDRQHDEAADRHLGRESTLEIHGDERRVHLVAVAGGHHPHHRVAFTPTEHRERHVDRVATRHLAERDRARRPERPIPRDGCVELLDAHRMTR
jgi:hypothetical protein